MPRGELGTTSGPIASSSRSRSSGGGSAWGAAKASAAATASISRSCTRQRSHVSTCSSTSRSSAAVEAVQGVARDQLVDVFHSCSGFMPDWASSSRRAAIAAKVRLLTVPIGSASRSASSDCVYPAK